MKTIGIAGGIGSGKSVVSRILRLRGCAVYDCDFEARRIMDSSEEVHEALHQRFGNEVCTVGGPINRPRLAQYVFESDDHRLWLNSLVHRLVIKDVKAWRKAFGNTGAEVCYVESAILASSGLAHLCDEIWIVSAPEDIRIERVKARNSTDEVHIRKRIRSQQEEERLILESGIPVRIVDNGNDASLTMQL